MKLGLGLYRHMLNAENYRFARQCGCSHVVAHLVDYFHQGADNERENQPTGGRGGWGRAGDPNAWHAGMGYALGYIRALLQRLDRGHSEGFQG